MSDLQCPFRVYLARHGAAEFETELFINHGGSLTTAGRAQARDLGKGLRAERIAHVYCSPLSRAVQTAELAAAVLGVEVTVREGLVEVALGEALGTPVADGAFDEVMEAWVAGDVAAMVPSSESALEIAARVQAVLDDLADRHRGEAVLVVSHAAALVATLAVLAFRPGRSSHVENCERFLLERDVDGWRLG